jgi:hypothetical protein
MLGTKRAVAALAGVVGTILAVPPAGTSGSRIAPSLIDLAHRANRKRMR